MEFIARLMGSLLGIAVGLAVIWTLIESVAKVLLAPVHAKLDRLIELQESRSEVLQVESTMPESTSFTPPAAQKAGPYPPP